MTWVPYPPTRYLEVANVRVAICDDSPLWRHSLLAMLEGAGIEVVAEAASGGELLARLEIGRPDIVVLDLQLTDERLPDGLEIARQVRERWPTIAVLLLSAHLDAIHLIELFKDGETGLGALSKDRIDDVPMLVDALERLVAGGTVADKVVVMKAFRLRTSQTSVLRQLTERQSDTLMLLAEGLSNFGIAQELSITEKAVESLVRGVFQRIGLADDRLGNRRVLAAIEWLKENPAPTGRRVNLSPRQ